MMLPKHFSEQVITFFFTSEPVASRPAAWELALHTGDPGAGDSNEVSEAAYERMPADFVLAEQAGHWEVSNTADIVFPAAGPGGAYTVTHFTIRDAGTGEALAAGPLPVPIPVVESGVISFAAGDIIVRGV